MERLLRFKHIPVFVLLLLLLSTSCFPASAPPTIKVGLVAPFSGREGALGYNMLFAAKLALDQWNQRGGVRGYYIELVAQDDRNEAETGALQARKMALDPQVVEVVGHPSAESALAAAPVYRQAGLPLVVVGAGLSEVATGGPPVFQLGPTESELAREAARLAAAQGARRLALVAEAAPSAQGLAQAVAQVARAAGLEVAFSGVLTPGQDGEAKLVEALRDARPDLVFYEGSYVEGGGLLARMRAQGLAATFLAGLGLASPDFLKIAGRAAEGTYYLSPAPYPSGLAGAREFLDAYRALAGAEPRPEALLTYDGVNAMLEGLERASGSGRKPGREALWEGLAQGQHQGLSGPIAFDGQGIQAGARAYIYHIEGMVWPGGLVR